MKKIFASCFLLGAAGLLWAVDVHVDKGADPAVKFAAKDLARCLTEVSGQTFQTVPVRSIVPLGAPTTPHTP